MGEPQPQGVLCAGNIVLDLLVRPVDAIRWGTTTWVETIEQHLGGNGANTSYTLAKMGVLSRLLGVVGKDVAGERLLASLGEAGVDTGFIGRLDTPTSTTVVLVSSGGERTFLHRPGSTSEAFGEPVRFTAGHLAGISHYHLANLFAFKAFRPHAAESLRLARAAGLTTSMDTGWDSSGRWIQDVGPCLVHIGTLFVNREEARMLTGIPDVEGAAARLRDLGAGEVIVKLGEDGCVVFSDEGTIREPGFKVDAVDTTGAGDCFTGAFLAARQRGRPLAAAARYANAAGALSVRQLGAGAALPDWDAIEDWINRQGRR